MISFQYFPGISMSLLISPQNIPCTEKQLVFTFQLTPFIYWSVHNFIFKYSFSKYSTLLTLKWRKIILKKIYILTKSLNSKNSEIPWRDKIIRFTNSFAPFLSDLKRKKGTELICRSKKMWLLNYIYFLFI